MGLIKRKQKRGLWSPEEDQKLQEFVLQFGVTSWTSLPANAGLQRNGKSCRLRWMNYLRPGLKRGVFSPQEEDMILTLHKNLGNKWSLIAKQLPGRTDNEIKNVWHSYLKKKAAKSEKLKINPEQKSTYFYCKEENVSPLIELTTNVVPEFELETRTIQNRTMPNVEHRDQAALPKIVFSEWLTADFQQNSSKDGLESSMSEKQDDDDFMQCFRLDEGSSILIDKFEFGQGEIGDGMLDSLPFSVMALSAQNAAYSGL
ncbi:hypothetical protein vseg_011867 [Gypsophila vaccaria]